jgi:hypothetical protein
MSASLCVGPTAGLDTLKKRQPTEGNARDASEWRFVMQAIIACALHPLSPEPRLSARIRHLIFRSFGVTFYALCFLPEQYFSSELSKAIDPTTGIRPTTLLTLHVPMGKLHFFLRYNNCAIISLLTPIFLLDSSYIFCVLVDSSYIFCLYKLV